MSIASHPNASTACVRPRALVVGDFVNDTPVTVAWCGELLVHREQYSTTMHGLELSRRTILITGEQALEIGETVNLQMELEGVSFFVVATVEWMVRTGDLRVMRLRLGVTCPEGNDLIARAVGRDDGMPSPAEREQTEPMELDAARTDVWRRPADLDGDTVVRFAPRRAPVAA